MAIKISKESILLSYSLRDRLIRNIIAEYCHVNSTETWVPSPTTAYLASQVDKIATLYWEKSLEENIREIEKLVSIEIEKLHLECMLTGTHKWIVPKSKR